VSYKPTLWAGGGLTRRWADKVQEGERMITKDRALQFAQEWVEAWNAHDLERVLSHYTDDFEMSTPFIAAFAGEPSGTLKGKDKVGAYWQTALKRIPDLRFELLDVFTCVNSIAIYYKSVLGKLATEVFFFDQDGKVYKALAHYNG
jgi:hypothetical protein